MLLASAYGQWIFDLPKASGMSVKKKKRYGIWAIQRTSKMQHGPFTMGYMGTMVSGPETDKVQSLLITRVQHFPSRRPLIQLS